MEDGVDKSKNRAETRADELQLFDVDDTRPRMSGCPNAVIASAREQSAISARRNACPQAREKQAGRRLMIQPEYSQNRC